ncbi:TPT-domain-containing protein [Thozetella sp. PMI_491]|nr:TPT-domain-containing protein [Thozetella sp. PMI_491]
MASSPLPLSEGTPVSASPPQAGHSWYSALYIIIYIASSNLTIVFNKWLIDTAGFAILLTSWHLIFAALVTQILARTTNLVDGRHNLPVNRRFYARTIMPIGIMATGSLICSNLVYLYLNVAFIQMLKAVSPVAMLFVSWMIGIANPTFGSVVNILVIVTGVFLSSLGQVNFSWTGTAFQLSGTMFETFRVVLIELMLKRDGLKMDPMVGLYYYAPTCAAMNFLVALFAEVPRLSWDDFAMVGFPILLLNAAVAFFVNWTSMVLIANTSGLVSSLTGIFKNILLVVSSVLFWNTHLETSQVVGYSLSLSGLAYYSFGYQQLMSAGRTVVIWFSKAAPVLSSELANGRWRWYQRFITMAALVFLVLLGGYYLVWYAAQRNLSLE